MLDREGQSADHAEVRFRSGNSSFRFHDSIRGRELRGVNEDACAGRFLVVGHEDFAVLRVQYNRAKDGVRVRNHSCRRSIQNQRTSLGRIISLLCGREFRPVANLDPHHRREQNANRYTPQSCRNDHLVSFQSKRSYLLRLVSSKE